MQGYIYLAGPYTHKSERVRRARFNALTKKAAELMDTGHVVYSPITHGHAIAERHDLPVEFEFWREQCFELLRHASKLIVLNLPGVEDSVGVTAEVELAKSLGLPIELHGWPEAYCYEP